MYKIGDFSKMSKTTIKTLRYYENEGLLIPAYVDPYTSYRYYESSQLTDLTRIISLRQAGLSINDIKEILIGNNVKEKFCYNCRSNAGSNHQQSADAVNYDTCDKGGDKSDNNVQHNAGSIVLSLNMRGG